MPKTKTQNPAPQSTFADIEEAGHQRLSAIIVAADQIVAFLTKYDYKFNDKAQAFKLTEKGSRKIWTLAHDKFLVTVDITTICSLVEIALYAHKAYQKDVDYAVADGEIIPIEKYTRQLQPRPQFPLAIRRAIQAKERVAISPSAPLDFTEQPKNPIEISQHLDTLVHHPDEVTPQPFTVSHPPQPSKDLPDHVKDKRPEYLAALLATVPQTADYTEQARIFEELSHGFRLEMASRLQSAMIAHIQAMPHDTHEEKRAIVKWANEELRRFDLAIKSPKSDRTATLNTDLGNHPEEGRFRLMSVGDGGKRETFSTPKLSELLENLHLVEATPRREPLAEWHEKVGRRGGGAARS